MMRIRPMVGRDQDALAECYPEKGYEHFAEYYLEHLQDMRTVFVAVHKSHNDDETTHEALVGYVTIRWESPHTHFWRRNVPEIVDLNVIAAYRRQGIGSALVDACEKRIRERGYPVAGISVVQDKADYAQARRLYPQLGYVYEASYINEDNEVLHHLAKQLGGNHSSISEG